MFATPKPLKYSIFTEEKFISECFALHNSKIFCNFASFLE